MIIEIAGQQIEVDDSFGDLSPEEQQAQVNRIAAELQSAQTEEESGDVVAPAAGAAIGAATGAVTGPAVGAAVDVAATKAAEKATGPKGTPSRDKVEKWLSTQTKAPYAGGQTYEEAYKKSEVARGKPVQSRGSQVPIRKGFLGIQNQPPEPSIPQKAAANILSAERLGKPSIPRRIGGMTVMGGEAGKTVSDIESGNYGDAILSGIGTIGGALSQSNIRPLRALGTGLSLLVPTVQGAKEVKDVFYPPKKEEAEEKAAGGLVHLAGGKRVISEEGGSKIMDILKNRMAPLYAKSEGTPPRLPRAMPKTDAELFEFAKRMAPQVRGDFVAAPGKTTSVAGKTRAQFEREKGLQHDIRDVPGLTIKPSNYNEAAYQNKVKIGIAGDQTPTGKDVYAIAGNPLSSPSRQYGGALYPAAHPLGWASEKEAAQGVQNLVDTAAKQYGDVDVLGEFMKMGPEASNYAMHNADAIIKSINPAQVKQLDELNRMIRAKFPDFAGVENQADILQQAKQNPELRKFLDYLVNTKKHAETYGLPSGQDIRHALSEPDLRDLEIGASGKSVIQMVPGGKISPSSEKTTTTYSHDIPGTYLGGTKYPRPYQLEFPDSYAALQNKISNVQDLAKQVISENPNIDPQAAIEYAKKYANQGFGGFRLAQPRQIMDQQYMDEIGKYEDYMKKLLGFKEGGSTTPAWQRKEGKSPSGGLNALGRASYKRETGGTLKAPQPEGGSRKKSFCARMGGMKKKLTSAKTANDPDSRINKALRKWKC